MESKHTTAQKFAQVESALDWAYRQGYVDGETAGQAFADITGRTMSKHDLGQYGDQLKFDGPQVPAAPDLLEALVRLTSIAKVLEKEGVLKHYNEKKVIEKAEAAIAKAS